MPKPRKMLSDCDAPYIQSLMRLIEAQSKETIVNWCVTYAESRILPIYEKSFPGDLRPRTALCAARDWLTGAIKLPLAKRMILDAHAAAREAEANPAAQAAARAVGQSAAAIHVPTHCLGLALYGAVAVAYDRLSVDAKAEEFERATAEECCKMEAALLTIAVENEPHPAKIKWYC